MAQPIEGVTNIGTMEFNGSVQRADFMRLFIDILAYVMFVF